MMNIKRTQTYEDYVKKMEKIGKKVVEIITEPGAKKERQQAIYVNLSLVIKQHTLFNLLALFITCKIQTGTKLRAQKKQCNGMQSDIKKQLNRLHE